MKIFISARGIRLGSQHAGKVTVGHPLLAVMKLFLRPLGRSQQILNVSVR